MGAVTEAVAVAARCRWEAATTSRVSHNRLSYIPLKIPRCIFGGGGGPNTPTTLLPRSYACAPNA